jgi:anaerobic selenocysteine-containing dehydrogenase
MGALDPSRLADVEALRGMTGKELRDLGRLPYPMLRRRGEPGFARIGWDEALGIAADRVRSARERAGADGDRIGFYLTARGITNEVYYVAQKVARFLGTNSVDNAARICHAPSTGALKAAIGVAATTVSYTDVIDADLVVFFGADVPNAQPVFMKYLYMARKRGTRVAVVNPMREPGMEAYWVPSNVESAMFGTRMTDEFFGVHTGGDIAFLTGVLKILADEGLTDAAFIEEHTAHWPDLVDSLDAYSLEALSWWSGASVDDMRRFARMYAAAERTVLVWSMGITQHV